MCNLVTGYFRKNPNQTNSEVLAPITSLKGLLVDDRLKKSILCLSGVNADLRYFIDTGNEQNSFNLDVKTGVLTLARKLDYETR